MKMETKAARSMGDSIFVETRVDGKGRVERRETKEVKKSRQDARIEEGSFASLPSLAQGKQDDVVLYSLMNGSVKDLGERESGGPSLWSEMEG